MKSLDQHKPLKHYSLSLQVFHMTGNLPFLSNMGTLSQVNINTLSFLVLRKFSWVTFTINLH